MDKPKHMENEATSPVHYVFAFSTGMLYDKNMFI